MKLGTGDPCELRYCPAGPFLYEGMLCWKHQRVTFDFHSEGHRWNHTTTVSGPDGHAWDGDFGMDTEVVPVWLEGDA